MKEYLIQLAIKEIFSILKDLEKEEAETIYKNNKTKSKKKKKIEKVVYLT